MSFLLKIIIIVASIAACSSVYAADSKKQSLASADIKNIENYLNNITTLTADFLQIAPSGEESSGQFFLSRPGKLRWEYNPPVPILIIANGSVITYYDSELKQVSYVSSNSTLAGFLTRNTIRFTGDVEVINSNKAAGLLRITIIQKGKKEEGQLTLICNENPLTLRKLEVIDASGQLTTITLSTIKYGQKLDKKLFFLQNLPVTKVKKH